MYVSFVQLINPTTRVSIHISALKMFMFLGKRHFTGLLFQKTSSWSLVFFLFTEILIGPIALNIFWGQQ